MQSLNRLYTRFKQMKYSPVTGNIIFDPLANALEEQETILKLVEGSYQKSLGVLLATDLRIFYIGVNRFNKTTLEEIRYENIASIEMTEPKIISVEISIKARNDDHILIKGCDYNEGKQFVELIRMLTLFNAQPQSR